MSTIETVRNLVIPGQNTEATTGTTDTNNKPLYECVKQALQNYFNQLGDQTPANVYDLVIGEVEAPLLEEVMKYTRGNQSRAAILLGLSRGTLRKKLKIHDLLD